MKVDLFVAEIGSTTTVVNALNGIGSSPAFVGQGQAPTTVTSENGVIDGLNQAIHNMREALGVDNISCEKMFATSSAAGGLRMTVHGLVFDMTLKAAREAALGAGANL
ncbi:MAG: glutamate mutase L, partial [Treponema sp.]|nr:glutamate mutase L [Treponema sp.]